MRPVSRTACCWRSFCARHIRSSLVEIGGLMAHPRTINEITHASPVDRMLIEYHTNNGLTAQSQSQSFALRSVRIAPRTFCTVAYATSANGARKRRIAEAVKPALLDEEVFSEACWSSSSVPQAPISLGRSRPRRSTIWCQSTFPTFLFHRRAKRERLDRELV
jgi:hypothetical protein